MMLDPATAKARLASAEWLQRPATRRLFAALAAAGVEARVVGGAVRNTLLGVAVDDIDIATPAPPETIVRIAQAAGFAAIPTGIEHGTITVVIDHHPFEITTLRRDVSTDGRRATVAFTTDWRADAERRDFTINALYCEPDGTLHDPVGGLPDLAQNRVRFIGDADTRIAEDHLRILRFFRFFARFGVGALDRDGALACERGRAGIGKLSRERVHAELMKLLVAPRVTEAVDALAAHGLLPLVLGGVGYPGRLAQLVACEAAAGGTADAPLRLAALTVVTHEDAERVAQRLAASRSEAAVLVDWAAGMPNGTDRERLYQLGPDRYRRALLAQWTAAADAGDTAVWQARARLPDRWNVPVMPISGRDLIAAGIPPGPKLGACLAHLERAWIDSDFQLSGQALLAMLPAAAD
jgi:poly(A) polymerase